MWRRRITTSTSSISIPARLNNSWQKEVAPACIDSDTLFDSWHSMTYLLDDFVLRNVAGAQR
jgi:hypothetical protein